MAAGVSAADERRPEHTVTYRYIPLQVRQLQTSVDLNERKPWRKEGHPFVGKPVRRFFTDFGASDGKITGCATATVTAM